MKKNNFGRTALMSLMLMGMFGDRQATPEEAKMLSDFLRGETKLAD